MNVGSNIVLGCFEETENGNEREKERDRQTEEESMSEWHRIYCLWKLISENEKMDFDAMARRSQH